MILSCPLISNSSNTIIKPMRIFMDAFITIYVNLTIMCRIFLVLWPGIIRLNLIFTLCSDVPAKSTIRQVLLFSLVNNHSVSSSSSSSYYYYYYYYYYYLLIRFFFISVSCWFFTGVWVTANLLKSPGLFSVFFLFSIMLSFGWSPLVRQLSTHPVPIIIL